MPEGLYPSPRHVAAGRKVPVRRNRALPAQGLASHPCHCRSLSRSPEGEPAGHAAGSLGVSRRTKNLFPRAEKHRTRRLSVSRSHIFAIRAQFAHRLVVFAARRRPHKCVARRLGSRQLLELRLSRVAGPDVSLSSPPEGPNLLSYPFHHRWRTILFPFTPFHCIFLFFGLLSVVQVFL